MFNERDYDQAMDVLHEFGTKLRATIEGMKTEAETCALNMEGDVIAQNASANLLEILNKITAYLDTKLKRVLSMLEEEKEIAIVIAQGMNDGRL